MESVFSKRILCLRKTSIGWLLIAKSSKGICNISLGDTAEQLLQEFTIRFNGVQQDINDKAFDHQEISTIVSMVETPRLIKSYRFSLDIRGTAFQRKVWAALREMRCGETISYGELAQRICMPNAIRAVAHACARNELALIIPCHRVVRKNGSLSGYRWGALRKQILLQREQQKDCV
ncbi:methylated-DNA--[protein]-cysteine S-methyltransferase [Bartonella sp. F02]|uniref:methylated-DNA--[protein]-cysteine S-methyltransferase n=1 Tax=Bartonella sp. F02 TaxID=2967262 RepID=UPI0022A9AA39|nr:methylated-DNA--[protein]-cysteine S-methyltransferase [Bartonella sp. F02]MCZ2328512.1 methylated-DNA--[protein]-cysteine S-methyltransferase [Bartonella sp. F02]